ncbi:hypothetical protein DDE18_14120 [Nocardioides gansuensis]|uniref:Cyclase n=1 Tax=Nocardioides gansuensis TaxID=2138300 RepID=A0A2T8F824_9ACTN|nr:hypothetical protein [Nocardioides gansuensis]PVG81855.1 hypothetical protein DDE18_14120 [Nocardioides gansuensis]
MTTLRIEHPISDYPTWRSAFDRFESARQQAGVLAYHVRRPVDDDAYVLVDLEFTGTDQAERFLAFLRETVWATPANSPALAGGPITRILEDAS